MKALYKLFITPLSKYSLDFIKTPIPLETPHPHQYPNPKYT